MPQVKDGPLTLPSLHFTHQPRVVGGGPQATCTSHQLRGLHNLLRTKSLLDSGKHVTKMTVLPRGMRTGVPGRALKADLF